MMHFLRVLACVLSAGLLFPAAAAAQSGFHPSAKVSERLGKDIASILADATSVEVFRLGVDPKKTPPAADGKKFVERPIVGNAPAPPADLLARALTVLSAEVTYFSSDSQGCDVGVGFRFRTASGKVLDIRCCMQKGNVLAEITDASGTVSPKRELGGFREDKTAPMRALAAALFPDDAEIQKRAPKLPDAERTPAPLTAPLAAPADASSPPEMPKFGKPGEVIHYASVALTHPKKSSDRAEGGTAHVFFTLWIPEGVKVVRGIYHTPFNLDTVEKEQSRAMARQWSFAIVGGNFMRVHKDDFAPSLLTGVRDLAAQSGHAELNNAPFIFTSMSAGVGMCVTLAEQLPELTLACGLVCLEVAPETERTRDVPMMSIFGEKDGGQMAAHVERLPKTRAALGSSWAIVPQWGRRHEWALANNLLWPFFDEVIRQRYPADASPADGPVNLRHYDPARVWLGDPADWATIAPLEKYPGDKAAACWLPGEDVARVWQSFAVRKPFLRITAPEPQGDKKPLAVFAPGAGVTVQVQCDATLSAQKITLFDRATRLAESDVKDGKCELRAANLAPGFHTLIAHAVSAEGHKELSRPVTILIQPPLK